MNNLRSTAEEPEIGMYSCVSIAIVDRYDYLALTFFSDNLGSLLAARGPNAAAVASLDRVLSIDGVTVPCTRAIVPPDHDVVRLDHCTHATAATIRTVQKSSTHARATQALAFKSHTER